MSYLEELRGDQANGGDEADLLLQRGLEGSG